MAIVVAVGVVVTSYKLVVAALLLLSMFCGHVGAAVFCSRAVIAIVFGGDVVVIIGHVVDFAAAAVAIVTAGIHIILSSPLPVQ